MTQKILHIIKVFSIFFFDEWMNSYTYKPTFECVQWNKVWRLLCNLPGMCRNKGKKYIFPETYVLCHGR